MSGEEADVRLKPEDIDKLEKWYEDVCKVKGVKPPFMEWLKEDPDHGTNHRILGRFFNLKNTCDQDKLEYFLKVYMHQAAGDRAPRVRENQRRGI